MKPIAIVSAALLASSLYALTGCATRALQTADTKPAALEKTADAATAQCQTVTGTRIASRKPEDCAKSASPVRVYTKDDIDRTGATDLGDALRQLDPRFQ